MRRIEPTTAFKRDYKRVSKGLHRAALKRRFSEVVSALADDQPLPARCRDHPLTGDWKDHRDCHLWPDLVLIYRKPDALGFSFRTGLIAWSASASRGLDTGRASAEGRQAAVPPLRQLPQPAGR